MELYLSSGSSGWIFSRLVSYVVATSLFLGALGFFVPVMAQPQGPPPGGMPNSKSMTPDPLVAAASRWDANQDGVFTCDEWKQFVGRIFTVADKNADGFLDAKEFQHVRVVEPTLASADISYFDDNLDQRVSRKEFVDKPSPFLTRYDINRDCRVTAGEIDGLASPPRKDMGPPGMGSPRGGAGRGMF